jgi:WXG100 family type VII secretion target
MNRLTVSTQELTKSVSDLTEKSCSIKRKIAELLELQENLSTQWSGDASVAFAQAFQADYAQWINFAQVLDNYIQTLIQISQYYENAESKNLEIIASKSRTYPNNIASFIGEAKIINTNVKLMYAAPEVFNLFNKISE